MNYGFKVFSANSRPNRKRQGSRLGLLLALNTKNFITISAKLFFRIFAYRAKAGSASA